MTTFVWTLAVLLGIEAFCQVLVLASGVMPKRTPSALAISAVINAGLMCWALVLLL